MHKILHIADLHLGFEHRYLGDRAAKRAEEALQTLERVIDWAVEDAHEIAAVLIAGDLFETHQPEAKLVGRVITTLRRVPASGRTLVTVPGNHDELSYPESVYHEHAGRWPGVLVTNPHLERVATCDLGGLEGEIHALAYTAGVSDRVLQVPPATPADRRLRIAVLHGTLDRTPTDRSFQIDSPALEAGGFRYAALGHIHKPGETRLGDGLAVYPGTLVGKGFDDPGVSELVVVTFPGQSSVVERLPFPTRPIRIQTEDLGRYETLDGLIAELERTANPQAIVRLELSGIRPRDYDAELLRGRIEGRFLHVEVDDQSLVIADAELERLTHQPTIKGIFTRLMRQRIADAGDDPEQQRIARLALMKGLTTFETSGSGR